MCKVSPHNRWVKKLLTKTDSQIMIKLFKFINLSKVEVFALVWS